MNVTLFGKRIFMNIIEWRILRLLGYRIKSKPLPIWTACSPAWMLIPLLPGASSSCCEGTIYCEDIPSPWSVPTPQVSLLLTPHKDTQHSLNWLGCPIPGHLHVWTSFFSIQALTAYIDLSHQVNAFLIPPDLWPLGPQLTLTLRPWQCLALPVRTPHQMFRAHAPDCSPVWCPPHPARDFSKLVFSST